MPELYGSGIFFGIILKQSKNIGLSLSYAYFRNFAFITECMRMNACNCFAMSLVLIYKSCSALFEPFRKLVF